MAAGMLEYDIVGTKRGERRSIFHAKLWDNYVVVDMPCFVFHFILLWQPVLLCIILTCLFWVVFLIFFAG